MKARARCDVPLTSTESTTEDPSPQAALATWLTNPVVAQVATTPDGRIIEAGQQAETLLAVPGGPSIVGSALEDHVVLHDRQALQHLLSQLNAGLRGRPKYVHLCHTCQGAPAVVAAFPQHSSEGEIKAIRWMIIPQRVADAIAALPATQPVECDANEVTLRIEVACPLVRQGMAGADAPATGSRDRPNELSIGDLLVAEREVLDSMVTYTPSMLAYFDRNFVYVWVNAAYARCAGLSFEALVGKNHFELFPDSESRALFEMVRDSGESVIYRARPCVNPYGPEPQVAYRDWELTPVASAGGEVRGLVLTLIDVTERTLDARERERLLGQLGLERAQLSALFDNLPQGIVMVDGAGRIVKANPAAERLGVHRISPDAAQADDSGALLLSADGARCPPYASPLARAVYEDKTVFNEDMTVMRPDGLQRSLLVNAVPIRGGAGERAGAVGVYQDVTARRAGQEQLRQYATRLATLRDMDRAVLKPESVDEILATALPRLQDALGCRGLAVGLRHGDEIRTAAFSAGDAVVVRPGPAWPIAYTAAAEVLGAGEPYVAEDLTCAGLPPSLEALLAGKGIRAFIAVPMATSDDLIGLLVVLFDEHGVPGDEGLVIAREVADSIAITLHHVWLHEQIDKHAAALEETVRARTAALKTSEARFRAIFEEAPLGVLVADLDGVIIQANSALQRMLGYSESELQGRSYLAFAVAGSTVPGSEAAETAGAPSPGGDPNERCFLRKDGSQAYLRLAASEVRTTGDTPGFLIVMAEDITSEKETHEALIRAEKLQTTGELAATLAHEIGNPLQAVMGSLELMREILPESEEVNLYLSMALDEVRRANGIVRELRELNRPSQPGDREPTDVSVLIEGVLLLGRPEARHHDVEIVWARPDADAYVIPLVRDRVHQVFLNMVLNAIAAMPDGGRLEISLARTDAPAGVVVTFRDSGVGIPPQALNRIFEPFYTTKARGLGLGLYVSHGIVTDHGGRIDVESVVGQGTTFSVWLPALGPLP